MDARNLESEIERSLIEAESLTEADLILTPENLEKYKNVTAGALEPLRHAYYLLGGGGGHPGQGGYGLRLWFRRKFNHFNCARSRGNWN
ncbi:MAG: hypothetical protein ACRD2P_00055 [Terriglobia bacterium]